MENKDRENKESVKHRNKDKKEIFRIEKFENTLNI